MCKENQKFALIDFKLFKSSEFWHCRNLDQNSLLLLLLCSIQHLAREDIGQYPENWILQYGKYTKNTKSFSAQNDSLKVEIRISKYGFHNLEPITGIYF